MVTIRAMTHERRAGHEERGGAEPSEPTIDLRTPRQLPIEVADDPDELPPEMPPVFFRLPQESDA